MGTDIVTGGCGFIGSHLVDALKSQGREVYIIDKKNSPFDDIRGTFDFPDNVEHVFHLAALADIVPSIENPVEYFQTNVTGTLNVLEAARKAGCKKFVYAASGSCYGDKPPLIPTPESCSINVKYPYALTKYMGEQLVMHWAKVYKIPAISLRLFNVYGLRSRTSGAYGAMFGTFLAQIANKKPLTIVGDGTQERDFVHVSDVVNAFIFAAESNFEGIYNVGSGESYSINKIVDLLETDNVVHIPKRPGEPDITWADTTKINRDLGWAPEMPIEDGVQELIAHIDDWKDAPVWDAVSIADATKEWFAHL